MVKTAPARFAALGPVQTPRVPIAVLALTQFLSMPLLVMVMAPCCSWLVYVQVTTPWGATVMFAWLLFVLSWLPLEPLPVAEQVRLCNRKLVGGVPSVTV